MVFSTLSYQNSWQATPEAFTVFGQYVLSLFSRLDKAHTGFTASPLTLWSFIAKVFSNAAFLFEIDCYMYSFFFQYFHFFSFAFRAETVVVGVHP